MPTRSWDEDGNFSQGVEPDLERNADPGILPLVTVLERVRPHIICPQLKEESELLTSHSTNRRRNLSTINSHIEEHQSAPSLIWNAPSKIQQGCLLVRNED